MQNALKGNFQEEWCNCQLKKVQSDKCLPFFKIPYLFSYEYDSLCIHVIHISKQLSIKGLH